MKTSVLTDRTTAAPTKIVLTQRVPLAVFQVNETITPVSNTTSNNNNEISDSAVEYWGFKPRLQSDRSDS